MQGRHAIFFAATAAGLSPLEIQAWGRWYANADMFGYFKNDEALLARLSRMQVCVCVRGERIVCGHSHVPFVPMPL